MRVVFEKILQSFVVQFEFSYTYLAHRHGVQHNVGQTFFIQRLQTFFIFATFLRFQRFYICLNVLHL